MRRGLAVQLPLMRVAAIYGISAPLAYVMAPQGLAWEFLASIFALLLVPVMRLPAWWLVINAVFLPALTAVLELELSPLWALAGLALLVLIYGKIWRSRVPIFFSSGRTHAALAELLPADRAISFLDAGCGDGRVLERLASARPDSRFDGIEHAPALWLAARLRLGGRGERCKVLRDDLWSRTLAPYDVVYAFLSPVVMERFWKKAQSEMRPGTLLVSAFAVPNVAPHQCVEVSDALGTCLHVWHIGRQTS